MNFIALATILAGVLLWRPPGALVARRARVGWKRGGAGIVLCGTGVSLAAHAWPGGGGITAGLLALGLMGLAATAWNARTGWTDRRTLWHFGMHVHRQAPPGTLGTIWRAIGVLASVPAGAVIGLLWFRLTPGRLDLREMGAVFAGVIAMALALVWVTATRRAHAGTLGVVLVTLAGGALLW